MRWAPIFPAAETTCCVFVNLPEVNSNAVKNEATAPQDICCELHGLKLHGLKLGRLSPPRRHATEKATFAQLFLRYVAPP